jgi:hypothetical protein
MLNLQLASAGQFFAKHSIPEVGDFWRAIKVGAFLHGSSKIKPNSNSRPGFHPSVKSKVKMFPIFLGKAA